ncbi:MAG: hypothetical protein WCI18_10695 [Pseudomonadota bacterium]
MMIESEHNFFSSNSIVISSSQLAKMTQIVQAVESVLEIKAYQELVFSRLSDAEIRDLNKSGLFVAYDFHVSEQGVGLIEINTNPGGAMLCAARSRVLETDLQKTADLDSLLVLGEKFEFELFSMFLGEWKNFNGDRSLESIAIVDENPMQQFLYPEFLLFQKLFVMHGIKCVIADPSELTLRDGALWVKNLRIDLVYNRLADFYFELPVSRIVRQAFVERLALVTPNPRAYALYADKRNLAVLSNKNLLRSLGVSAGIQDVLVNGIPFTEEVNGASGDIFWTNRRNLYFKPINGYGARAVYRGDKVTKKVWSLIQQGNYVAQKQFAPGEFFVGEKGAEKIMKFDVRLFVYNGRVLWVAGRVYQGQTTNFRTPGGGFAPVVIRS